MNRSTRQQSGFSLIEVMVALGVLSFGLLGIMLMQAQAMQQGSRGKHQSAALSIARDVYEQIPRMPFSDPNLAVNNAWLNPPWINNPPFNAGEIPVQLTDGTGIVQTEQIYRVWYRITPDVLGNADLRNIELQVLWTPENNPALTPLTRTNESFVAFSGMFVENDK